MFKFRLILLDGPTYTVDSLGCAKQFMNTNSIPSQFFYRLKLMANLIPFPRSYLFDGGDDSQEVNWNVSYTPEGWFATVWVQHTGPLHESDCHGSTYFCRAIYFTLCKGAPFWFVFVFYILGSCCQVCHVEVMILWQFIQGVPNIGCLSS